MGPAQNLVVHNKCYPWMGPFDLISGNLDRKLELLNRTFLQFKICDFEDSGVPNRSSNRKMHHPRANPLARSPSFNPLPQKPDLSAGILVVSLHDWMFFFGRKWSGQKVRDWVITHLATNLFHQPRNPFKCRLSTRFFLGGELFEPPKRNKKKGPKTPFIQKKRVPFGLEWNQYDLSDTLLNHTNGKKWCEHQKDSFGLLDWIFPLPRNQVSICFCKRNWSISEAFRIWVETIETHLVLSRVTLENEIFWGW